MSDKVEKKEVKEVKLDTTNPLNKGVSYEAFLENIKGNITVDSLLKKHNVDKATSEWIKQELEVYKSIKKK